MCQRRVGGDRPPPGELEIEPAARLRARRARRPAATGAPAGACRSRTWAIFTLASLAADGSDATTMARGAVAGTIASAHPTKSARFPFGRLDIFQLDDVVDRPEAGRARLAVVPPRPADRRHAAVRVPPHRVHDRRHDAHRARGRDVVGHRPQRGVRDPASATMPGWSATRPGSASTGPGCDRSRGRSSPAASGHWPRSSSPTWSIRPLRRRRLGDGVWRRHTRPAQPGGAGSSSIASVGARSTRPGTVSWPSSTARNERFAALRPSTWPSGDRALDAGRTPHGRGRVRDR